jgi:Fe-S oxidoreductase
MQQPAAVEIAIFLALCVVSGALFWRRIARVIRTILASRPDEDFSLTPLAPRVREFVWEVLLQAKVIRHRPWPGIAHALVFWGFCAFSLVTIDHFAAGISVELLRHDGGVLGPAWFAMAFLFAIGVSAGIAGLAIRRFVIRPRWLGEKASVESGVIALLILVLMITYIAEYLWHPAGTAGKVLWWLHTLALLVFLPLIPHTKHLHLLLSPVTVFLSRGGFAKIPPLPSDEDFGLETGKDLTRLEALQAYSCVECGRCMEHCPAHNTGKALNPKEIALGLRSYLNANGAGSGQPLLGVHLSEEAVFQCTTCGACEYQCPVGVEHVPLIIGLRRGAVNTGRWEDEYGGELFLKLERNGNPLGMSQWERDKFIRQAELPWFDGSQEFLLWLGCMGSYDPEGRETVEALARVLRHHGVTFGVLKKERCSGDAARRLGNDLAFLQLADFNIGQLKSAGAKRLISICPHCVRTIQEDWREAGATFDIVHHSELLASLPALRGGSGDEVVYHDPCYLGRYQDIYDAPRRVVEASGRLVEAARSRDRSFCCGAGGGLVFLGEEKGTRVSHERARELAATGAGTLAVACPFCRTMFRDALPAVVGEKAPRLVDIAQLAAARLPGANPPSEAA